MVDKAPFGAWLKSRRKEYGYTQPELAGVVGCSTILIAKVEAGERRPSEQIAQLLADCLEIPREERAAFLRAARADPGLAASSHNKPSRAASPSPPANAPLNTSPGAKLPMPLTPLVGREQALAALYTLLGRDEVRLVTLTGAGGIGKTRVALQAAADLVDQFPDGVHFVELAAVRDTEGVPSAIAQSLGLKESGGVSLVQILKSHLEYKRTLLLLDNFEQVVQASALLLELLAAAPTLKVLVTSRTALRLRGEKEFPVPTLALPALSDLPPVEILLQYEALRLFSERAQDVKPDFHIDSENARAVAEICVRLDGLPLAIELAAARVRILPPTTMLVRLGKRLKLLTGGGQDLPARQQTLRSTIAWSYDLLSADEALLFRRLAVFVDSCSLEAAELVCGGQEAGLTLSDLDVLDGSESLARKSLLRCDQDAYDGRPEISAVDEPRLRMLQTIREYAWEQLEASGEAGALLRRHARYFLTLAEQAGPALRGPRQVEWLQRLEIEHENLQAALRWAEEGAQLDMVARFAAALGHFWFARGYLSEGRFHVDWLLERRGSLQLHECARVLHLSSRLALMQGDYSTSQICCEQALALFRQLGDEPQTGHTLNDLGNILGLQGDYTSRRRLHEESLDIFRALGDPAGTASALLQLGNVMVVLGDNETGRVLVEEGLVVLRSLGDKRGIAMALYMLGNFARSRGDLAAARPYYDEVLTLFHELGDRVSIANVLVNLGNIATGAGDYSQARSLLDEALAMYKMLGTRRGIADALAGLGYVAYKTGDYEAARARYRNALQMRRELGNKRGIVECLEALAMAAAMSGASERAALLFGTAEMHRATVKSPLTPADRVEYEASRLRVLTLLGEMGWSAAWEKGHALAVEAAVTLALEEDD